MAPQYPLALVTGAARRLGRALALTLARNGFAILLHYHRSSAEAASTLDEIRALGVPAYAQRADLSDTSGVAALVEALDALVNERANQLSSLGVLVNSAAVMSHGDVRALSVQEWDKTFALNLRAPFLLAQAAARRMTEGGLIVNISDVGAQKSWSRFPAYAVSKAALDSLTRVLARALAPSVRVNAIAPGLVLPAEGFPTEEWYRLIAKAPLKRPAAADEIGMALEFLLKNEYITGQTIAVDGGYSLT